VVTIGRKLTAHSCGGSHGIRAIEAHTVFPFHPIRTNPQGTFNNGTLMHMASIVNSAHPTCRNRSH
jgi:hypothetical protein